VARKFLNRAQVDPPHDQSATERVAQVMPPEVLDARLLAGPDQDALVKGVAASRPVFWRTLPPRLLVRLLILGGLRRREDPVRIVPAQNDRERFPGRLVQRHVSSFAVFGAPDRDHPETQVEVLSTKTQHFALTKPCVHREVDRCPVRRRHHRLELSFFLVQQEPDARVVLGQHLDPGHRVLAQEAVPDREVEQALEEADRPVHCGRRGRLAPPGRFRQALPAPTLHVPGPDLVGRRRAQELNPVSRITEIVLG